LRINNIVIVGGGTAGFMTATTFVRLFPDKKITLIESPNIKSVGVGESTIVQFRKWLSLVKINDYDFMKYCDASYKFDIRFTNFHKKSNSIVDYPFGIVNNIDDNKQNLWYIKKIIKPETLLTDYANVFFPIMALVNNNKVHKKNLDDFDFERDTAFHFDAIKFANWLRDNICQDIRHIQSEVKEVKLNENGIESLELENGKSINADLFIDCTGFKSLLLGKSLKQEFLSYSHILPNNKAWSTHIDYTDKEKQLDGVTNATGLKNGWVWNIPLWSRIGTGYVYSDKYTSDQNALQEFKEHLIQKGHDITKHEFRNIPMKIGIHKKLFVKNVVAIGLSAGFIEPLESNGLYTVHEFLHNLTRCFERDTVTQWDKDLFNLSCRIVFNNWAEFVAMHYALSERDDSQYWKDNMNREYDKTIDELKVEEKTGFRRMMITKIRDYRYDETSGISHVAAGYGYSPLTDNTLRYENSKKEFDYGFYLPIIEKLDERKLKWDFIVRDSPSLYNFLKDEVYNQ
jgi:hypothetical protein